MASSFLLVLFNVHLLFIFMDLVLFKSVFSNELFRENPIVQLSVSPKAGFSTENIEVRCEITPPSSTSPLSASRFDNVYLSVKTDSVKPSGILLMVDDSTDQCREIPEKKFHIDVCNASLILIHITHTIVNETLEKIDYVCSKGSTYVSSSYRIIEDRSARYYDSTPNTSSSLTHAYFPLLFLVVLIRTLRWLENN